MFLAEVLAPTRRTRIVDVGANPTDSNPYAELLAAGLCEVWGFEPHETAYAELVAAAGEKETYLPHAVGSGEPGVFRVCRGSGFSSLLEPNIHTFDALGRFHRGASVIAEHPVQTRRLDDMADLPEFDMLKIDVQGGECMVFEGARHRLGHALAVITEVAAIPLYVNQPLLDTQMRLLGEMGYGLHRFLSFRSVQYRNPMAARLRSRRYRSQLTDGDALFVRGLLNLGSLADEELKHLAILADSVFMSHDLVVVILSLLLDRGLIDAATADAYIDHLPELNERKEKSP